ncbi:MAG: hypothetical protein KDK39_04410 [Leptospiraceae bacterium]|nr:hypothetical protein [Leptospiraceae bacterium]
MSTVLETKQWEQSLELESLQDQIAIQLATDPADLIYALEADQTDMRLPCITELRPADQKSGVLFRDCLIDYTSCSVQNCVRKLV